MIYQLYFFYQLKNCTDKRCELRFNEYNCFMEQLDGILFYAIDKAIRSYRQFAQKRIKEAGFSITIDQWLVIKVVIEHPSIAQKDIGELVFKDNASVTRIIANLERDGYLKITPNKDDKRRSDLKVTQKGKSIVNNVQKVVYQNRSVALHSIDENEMKITQRVMETIAKNTKKP